MISWKSMQWVKVLAHCPGAPFSDNVVKIENAHRERVSSVMALQRRSSRKEIRLMGEKGKEGLCLEMCKGSGSLICTPSF